MSIPGITTLAAKERVPANHCDSFQISIDILKLDKMSEEDMKVKRMEVAFEEAVHQSLLGWYPPKPSYPAKFLVRIAWQWKPKLQQ